MIYAKSGDIYEGEWMSDMKSGFGYLYSHSENKIIKGTFRGDKPTGDGEDLPSEYLD